MRAYRVWGSCAGPILEPCGNAAFANVLRLLHGFAEFVSASFGRDASLGAKKPAAESLCGCATQEYGLCRTTAVGYRLNM